MLRSSDYKPDYISQVIGDYGLWQCSLTVLLSLCNIPSTWHIYAPTFFTPISNLTHKTTVSMEFNLTGGRQFFITLSESMFLSGVAIGGVVGGLLSDRYGRKKVLLASLCIQGILAFILVFVNNIESYIILRTMLGFICVTVVFSAFILAIELVAGNCRLIVGVLFLLPVSIGYITISCLAWFINHWRYLQLVIAISSFILLFFAKVIPESPRWLLSLNKLEALKEVLNEACKVNKLPPYSKCVSNRKSIAKRYEKVQIADLCGTMALTRTTILLFIMWFSLYLVYFGLVLKMDRLGSNIYTDSIIAACTEIVAILLTVLILFKYRTRYLTIMTFLGAGIACILTALFSSPQNHFLVFVMVGKFTISSTNAVMPLLTAELYPIKMRNMGVGACNIPAGISLIFIPHLWKLESFSPMYFLGTVAIIGSICTMLLPEEEERRRECVDIMDEFD